MRLAFILVLARPVIAPGPKALLQGFREVMKLGDPLQVLRLLHLLACPSTLRLASCASCTSCPAPALCACPTTSTCACLTTLLPAPSPRGWLPPPQTLRS